MITLNQQQLSYILNKDKKDTTFTALTCFQKAATMFCLGVRDYLTNSKESGLEYFAIGASNEKQCNFYGLNQVFINYIQKHGFKQIIKPFHDPLPHQIFIEAHQPYRQEFVDKIINSFPCKTSLSLLDLGCGSGEMLVILLEKLFNMSTSSISQLILIDASTAMLNTATTKLQKHFKNNIQSIISINSNFTDIKDDLPKVDIIISSQALHHLPYLQKKNLLTKLLPKTENFILYELDSSEDFYPKLDPHLLNSIYFNYGNLTNLLYDFDPQKSILAMEGLLMPELISICCEEYGCRSEYHMLASQWQSLLAEINPTFRLINYFMTGDNITFGHHYQKEQANKNE